MGQIEGVHHFTGHGVVTGIFISFRIYKYSYLFFHVALLQKKTEISDRKYVVRNMPFQIGFNLKMNGESKAGVNCFLQM